MPRPLSRYLFLATLFLALSGLTQTAAAQTATPSADVTAKNDLTCDLFAVDLLRLYAPYGLQNADIVALSNCFLDAFGNWFMVTGPNDPRIVGGPILTHAQAVQTAPIKRQIQNGVNVILASAATVPARNPGAPTGATFRDELDAVYSPDLLPVGGHLKLDGRVDADFYQNLLITVANQPDEDALKLYITWMADSATAIRHRVCGNAAMSPASSQTCDSTFIPLPYPPRLLDDLFLAEFSRYLLDHPGLLVPPIIATPDPAST